jgi:hypothetical protein
MIRITTDKRSMEHRQQLTKACQAVGNISPQVSENTGSGGSGSTDRVKRPAIDQTHNQWKSADKPVACSLPGKPWERIQEAVRLAACHGRVCSMAERPKSLAKARTIAAISVLAPLKRPGSYGAPDTGVEQPQSPRLKCNVLACKSTRSNSAT